MAVRARNRWLGLLCCSGALAQAPPGNWWEAWWEVRQQSLLRSREVARCVVRSEEAPAADCIGHVGFRTGALRPGSVERADVVKVLLPILEAGSIRERAAVLIALGEIGLVSDVDAAMAQGLRHGHRATEPVERAAAVLGLGLAGGGSAVDVRALQDAADDPDDEVAVVACHALAAMARNGADAEGRIAEWLFARARAATHGLRAAAQRSKRSGCVCRRPAAGPRRRRQRCGPGCSPAATNCASARVPRVMGRSG
jgi:hypothetical protein